ncbi:flagellar protein FlgN [Metallumcola ferriviriculae]|uniref:Flagellar protein FlgN n=1 Tax=Metallumcola ferriviriculae TaxID=3039180 RepID=A0AAU0URA7_9FIRM|nr:flagellar protein FlgN [Desulfitibacteraceae bacterium MK1]
MEQTFEELMGALKKEREIIDELVELAETETQLLINSDVQGLMQLVNTQQQAGNKLANLEKERLVLEKRLAGELSFEDENVRLTELIKAAGVSVPAGLQFLAEGMKKRYYQLGALNETNKLLIKQSLGYANKMLSVILPQRKTTYQESGAVKLANNASRLDQTV